MNSRPAYTVSPVIAEDAHGREVITDVALQPNHSSAVGRDGMSRGWQNDYIEDSDGNVRHVMENVELEDPSSPASFNEDEYFGALIEANPGIENAIAWGQKNLGPDFVENWDKIIDGDDLGRINQAIQELMEEYVAAGGNTVKPQEESSNEESEDERSAYEELREQFTDEEIAIAVEINEHLVTEPQGNGVADQWQMIANDALENGNETWAGLAAAAASFHANEVTAEEAIRYCLDNYDYQEMIKAFQEMYYQ